MDSAVDAIVVGGGVAGLVTARELRRTGRTVRLLEARDRFGGRCWTTRFADYPAEAGAHWFSWLHPHLWAEVVRYGLQVEGAHAVTEHQWRTENGAERATPDEFGEVVGRLVDRLCTDAGTALPRPFAPLAQWVLEVDDTRSVREALDGAGVTGRWRPVLESVLTGTSMTPNDSTSMAHVLRWYATAGGRMWGDSGRLTFRDGMGALIAALIPDAGPDLRLSSPVSRLKRPGLDRNGPITVVTPQGTHTASVVVLALPRNVLSQLEVDLELDGGSYEALRTPQPSRGVKLYARIEGALPDAFWRASDEHVLYAMRVDRQLTDSTIVVALGASSDRIDGNDLTAVSEAIRYWVPDARVLECWSHDWVKDEWSRGTWGASAPGRLSQLRPSSRNPAPGLFVAGADFADGWTSFVDGAIETGLSSADAVCRAYPISRASMKESS